MIDQPKRDNTLLYKYLGFATQLIVALAIAVFGGIKLDKWIGFKMPLAVWILPLVVIVALIYKAVKDTSPKK